MLKSTVKSNEIILTYETEEFGYDYKFNNDDYDEYEINTIVRLCLGALHKKAVVRNKRRLQKEEIAAQEIENQKQIRKHRNMKNINNFLKSYFVKEYELN